MSDEQPHQTVLDSDEQQVGALYGKALLGAAGDNVDQFVGELEAIVKECLDAHPALEGALKSPRISLEQKEGVLERIFGDRIDRGLLNFLKVLCRRDRIGSLRAIQAAATEIRQEQLGKLKVIVTSAHELNDEQRGQIADRLRSAYGKEIVLQEKIDASLLGGIVLRIGDNVLDGSVNGKLDAIKSAVSDGVQKAIRDKYDSLLST